MAWMAFRASGASALPVTSYYLASLSGRLDEGTLTDLLPGVAVIPHPKVRRGRFISSACPKPGN